MPLTAIEVRNALLERKQKHLQDVREDIWQSRPIDLENDKRLKSARLITELIEVETEIITGNLT